MIKIQSNKKRQKDASLLKILSQERMQYSVPCIRPLYCVVSCNQLICWSLRFLPFNRRKCCWKTKIQESQTSKGRYGGKLAQRLVGFSVWPATCFSLPQSRGEKCQQKRRKIAEMIHFKEAKCCRIAHHFHLASLCLIQKQDINNPFTENISLFFKTTASVSHWDQNSKCLGVTACYKWLWKHHNTS